MMRRGNFVKDVISKPVPAASFEEGMVVAPVIVDDADHFTGVVAEVDAKINKVYVEWPGGRVIQHDPDELLKVRFGKERRASARVATILTDRELIFSREIRDAICAEHATVTNYNRLSQMVDDLDFKATMQSLIREEKLHIGELTNLLDKFEKDELDTLEEGINENIVETAGDPEVPAVEIGEAQTGDQMPVFVKPKEETLPELPAVDTVDAPIEM